MADTKEKILQTSLYLFALDGYEGVSVSNIADEVDISKGALYKHFKNKRDIFDSIVNRMKELENERLPEIYLPKRQENELFQQYNVRVYDKIKESTEEFFKFWTEEPFARDFRRMIMLEQFRNPEMNDLYQKCLVSGPLNKIEKVFEDLQKSNPKTLAYKYYSQVYFLISLSDSAESLDNAESLLKNHLKEFGERFFFINEQLQTVKKPETKHKGLLQLAQEIIS